MKVHELMSLLSREDSDAEVFVVRVDLNEQLVPNSTKPVFGVRTGAAGVGIESI